MKNNYLFMVAISVCTVMACGQTKEEKTDSPGPITESDKTRYNLSPSDELEYGTIDSLQSDSARQDSAERHRP